MKSNKNGFSIVQVLVVVGIMESSLQGFLSWSCFPVKSSKNAQTMFDMTHVLEEIKSVLGDSINCSRSFNGLSADATRLAVPKVDFYSNKIQREDLMLFYQSILMYPLGKMFYFDGLPIVASLPIQVQFYQTMCFIYM